MSFMKIDVGVFLLLLIALPQDVRMADIVTSGHCAICQNGANITLPNQTVSIPGLDFIQDCTTLSSIAPIFQQGSDQCNWLQSIGSICGCPQENENACNLCGDGSKPLYGKREIKFLSSMFGGWIPTCDLLEAGLRSYNSTDPTCYGTKIFLADYCGCGPQESLSPQVSNNWTGCNLCGVDRNGTVPLPDKELGVVGLPTVTCGELAEAAYTLFEDTSFENQTFFLQGNECSLLKGFSVHCGCKPQVDDPCPICAQDLSFNTPFPERRLNKAFTDFAFPGLEMTCEFLGSFAQMFSLTSNQTSPICKAFQGMAIDCGCAPPPKPACEICSHPLSKDMYNYQISSSPYMSFLTCASAFAASNYLSDGDILPWGPNFQPIEFECRLFQYSGYVCGCNNGLLSLWGADTLSKQHLAIWTQRVAAFFSLLGSFAISVDILRNKKLKSSLYHQIVFGLSVADILSSTAWGLGPLPTPSDLAHQYGFDSSFFTNSVGLHPTGAKGTIATCKAQGFLLHLGFTSILYNVALSYYFKLSVVDGMREKNIPKWCRILMLSLPAVIGLGIAIAGIPFYTFSPVACTIGSHKDYGGWLKVIFLFLVPYGPAFIYLPINTFYIYWMFRRQSRRANKWRFRTVIHRTSLSIQASLINSTPLSNLDNTNTSSNLGNSSENLRMGRYVPAAFTNKPMKEKKVTAMESSVFWQSFWYVCSFFAAYFVFLLAFGFDGFEYNAYWFYMLLSIFTPLQGFFNSIVYFKKKQSLEKKKQAKWKATLAGWCRVSVFGHWCDKVSTRWKRMKKASDEQSVAGLSMRNDPVVYNGDSEEETDGNLQTLSGDIPRFFIPLISDPSLASQSLDPDDEFVSERDLEFNLDSPSSLPQTLSDPPQAFPDLPQSSAMDRNDEDEMEEEKMEES